MEAQLCDILENIGDYVSVDFDGQRRPSIKYRMTFVRYNVSCRNLEHVPFAYASQVVAGILNHILDVVLAPTENDMFIRLRIDSAQLRTGKPIWTAPLRKSQITVLRWMSEVERVLNSQEDFRFDEDFQVTVERTQLPSGGCRRAVPALLARKIAKMRSIVPVCAEDELCLARAIVVGKALVDGDSKLYKSLRSKKCVRKQGEFAKRLIMEAGLDERKFSIDDIPAFEKALVCYQIKVVSVDHLNAIVYNGPPCKKKIYLLHHDEHFDLLTKINRFMKKTYWCHTCNRGYDKKLGHSCDAVCLSCHRVDCERDKTNLMECLDCGRSFLGAGCFAEHKSKKTVKMSVCEKIRRCKECCHMYSYVNRSAEKQPHRCGEMLCKTCSMFVMPEEHHCYMKPLKMTEEVRKRNDEAKFLYFDLETYVNDDGVLVPNLAVSSNHMLVL